MNASLMQTKYDVNADFARDMRIRDIRNNARNTAAHYRTFVALNQKRIASIDAQYNAAMYSAETFAALQIAREQRNMVVLGKVRAILCVAAAIAAALMFAL